MSGSNAAVSLRDIHKRFGAKRVLRGISVDVVHGETFTLLGGSGTGKSVCLRHMIGLLEPDEGEVEILGRIFSTLGTAERTAVRKRCGMVFQGSALFDSLNVYENIAYPIREHERWPEERVAERVARCLESVGLPGVEPLLPEELSGGMRKRVGVARAIALEPELILYDEPTTGLDPANSKRIGEMMRELQERTRVTSVVVTHDLELCFAISDRVALLKAGQIVIQASVDEFRASDHPDVRAYFDGEYDEPDALSEAP